MSVIFIQNYQWKKERKEGKCKEKEEGTIEEKTPLKRKGPKNDILNEG